VFLTGHARGFQLIGGLCLLAIGMATIRSRPPERTRQPVHARNFTAAHLHHLHHPRESMTIAGFIGIYNRLRVGLTTTGLAQITCS